MAKLALGATVAVPGSDGHFRRTARYGLRYGLAPATGNFQRLRGRLPLVSPLKSYMRRSFTAVTRIA